ncbi:hypothetical protein VPKG_00035 [Vibrio phage pYD21-A]|uniref:hypothetical protein n=1 Tax=Vibrio phage pYD21-A TaxID=754049 RepID=UPI0002C0CC85|nr:hypothetical protein VPKG_00035 [Vibrio phage pYD21-A]AGH16072.1 hypothetical protein VPKG_00035 [Vibrio phage pYD21-A]
MSHIDRMKEEHTELKGRLDKINAFIHGNDIFNTLDDIDKADMIKQAGFMESYLSVLSRRIWRAMEK